jgi:cyclic 2,3-diphosphoglycerate synthetase
VTGEEVVVVAMGRGGPPEPELVDPRSVPLTSAALLERARAGRHAASDHLEDAVLAGVVTIGCRRCGGGLAGAVGRSNVVEGAALAADRRPGLTIFEGSGAAAPPIACDRTLLVSSVHAPPEEVLGHLGPVRVLEADLIVLGGAEDATEPAADRLETGLADLRPGVPIVRVVLRPAPVADVHDRRVAVFTTAPPTVHDAIRRHLETHHGAHVTAVTGSLAHRPTLQEALRTPAVAAADLWLTEIKAAAVDVVAEAAVERGVELSFFDNVPEAADGTDRLDRALDVLLDAARAGR